MIGSIIPPQNFELVRDRIANILTIEKTNQAVLLNSAVALSGAYLDSVVVEVERSNPVDKVEIPTFNVSTISNEFDKVRQGLANGNVAYAIDIYASAKTTATTKGDKVSSIRLQKLLGFVRYVLEDPIYKTLLFTPGFIGRTEVKGFQIKPISETDAENQSMARLTFNVFMKEENTLMAAPAVSGTSTQMTIDNTTSGYFVEENY